MKSKLGSNAAVKPFGIGDRVGYLMGDFGCGMSFQFISAYMMLFYTQYIGVSLVHYGFIILFTKIWDAINDPLIGALADKFTPKSGSKFLPWIFWGSFPLALGACVLFLDTSAWPYWSKILVCIVGYLIWDVAYTVVNVPYGSMNSTITADPVERSQLSTWRSFGAMCAALPMAVIVPQIAYKKQIVDGVEQSILQGGNLFAASIVMGILALVAFQLLYRLCKERVQPKDRANAPKFSYILALKGFFTNRSMLAVALATLAQVVFFMSTQATNGLVYQMYFGDGSLSSLAILAMIVPMLVCAPLVKPLVKRFGKKALCSWPILISAVAYALILVIPNISVVLFISLSLLASLGSGFYMMVGWALVSDCIDSIECETGRREEGSIYATYSMVRKLGQGIGQSLIPFIIAFAIAGLNMNDPTTWSPEYGLAIKNLSAILPLIGALITFVCFQWIYDLDNKRMQEIAVKLGRDVSNVEVSAGDAISAATNARED